MAAKTKPAPAPEEKEAPLRFDALARAISERMDELGFSQQDAHEESESIDPRGKGLSTRTWGVYERGDADREPYARTQRIIDLTLRWRRGTTLHVLRTGEMLEQDEMKDSERLEALEQLVAELARKQEALVSYVTAREALQ